MGHLWNSVVPLWTEAASAPACARVFASSAVLNMPMRIPWGLNKEREREGQERQRGRSGPLRSTCRRRPRGSLQGKPPPG
jgi:hypothetical protein